MTMFPTSPTSRRRWRTAHLAALAGAWLAGQPVVAQARELQRPVVPFDLEVPAGHRLVTVGHAVGTQNYFCVRKASGQYVWQPFGPQATVYNDYGTQVMTHFLSENPDEEGEKRATWQHSRDTSTVWAKISVPYAEPDFVAPGAIPWLLLEVVGDSSGTNASRGITKTRYIQRVNTSGGSAPTNGCTDGNLGDRLLVPYTTDYYFYEPAP